VDVVLLPDAFQRTRGATKIGALGSTLPPLGQGRPAAATARS
jgi:hypothetical protein